MRPGQLKWWTGVAWVENFAPIPPTMPVHQELPFVSNEERLQQAVDAGPVVGSRGTGNKSVWKNKWLWIGVAVVALFGFIVGGGHKDDVLVPSVSGKSAVDAQKKLEAAGFDVTYDKWFVSNRLKDFNVESTEPKAGVKAEDGSSVTLNLVETPEFKATEAAEEKAESDAEAKKDQDDKAEQAKRDAQREEHRREVPAAEALWLSNLGVGKASEMISVYKYGGPPTYAVQPGWKGSTDDWLEIKVQAPLNDETARMLGVQVLNFVGPEYPYLTGVQFTDSRGIDYLVNRRESPLAGPVKIEGID